MARKAIEVLAHAYIVFQPFSLAYRAYSTLTRQLEAVIGFIEVWVEAPQICSQP